MRRLGLLFGLLAAAAAAIYLGVYLYRWEWQRALTSGILLLVVEIFLVAVVLATRLGRVERQLLQSDARAEEMRRRLQYTRRDTPYHFRWLDEYDSDGTHRTFVFVPVLLLAGALLSGLALVIQKVAGATLRAGAERQLAGRLASLAAPPGVRGHVPRLEDQPAVPPSRHRRTALTVTISLGGLVLLALLIGILSDFTQTRPQAAPKSAATTVVFRVDLRNSQNPAARDLAARQIWGSCRRSTASVPKDASLTPLGPGTYAGVARPPLPDHDLLRLRGCLNDFTADRAKAKVLGEGQAPPTR